MSIVTVFLTLFLIPNVLLAADNMVIIIIDGARYTETFGDSSCQFIPNMGRMARDGSIINSFYNDSTTYTSAAIPALWCGTWTERIDTVNSDGYSTQYAVKPTIFEYYRKQKNVSADSCFYVLKYINSLWLPSFDADYGPEYWPTMHSVGSTDTDVCDETRQIMAEKHPSFILIYLADVDSKGHSGNWDAYTGAIQIADSIVAVIWNDIQSNPYYKDHTNLFVTNDHGRHTTDFRGHGCGCDGCRHIMFLAIGPDIKKNFVSTQYRRIPDMAVTACHLLDVNPDKATGEVMTELLKINVFAPELITTNTNSFSIGPAYPNPFNSDMTIEYSLSRPGNINISIYNYLGQPVATLVHARHNSGKYQVKWNGICSSKKWVSSGIYICVMRCADRTQTYKLLFQK